jgi:hypothetical protein
LTGLDVIDYAANEESAVGLAVGEGVALEQVGGFFF